jgi:hypothetical protein
MVGPSPTLTVGKWDDGTRHRSIAGLHRRSFDGHRLWPFVLGGCAGRLDHLSGMVSVAPSSATKIASRLAGSLVLAFALTR